MAITWTIDGQNLPGEAFDLFASDPEASKDTALRDSVLIALFTDKRAPDDLELPVDNGDRRGWWADGLNAADDAIGSLLWTLERRLANNETATLAEGYARDALAYLVRDSIAVEVVVVGSVVRYASSKPNGIALDITIRRGDRPDLDLRLEGLWEGVPSA